MYMHEVSIADCNFLLVEYLNSSLTKIESTDSILFLIMTYIKIWSSQNLPILNNDWINLK